MRMEFWKTLPHPQHPTPSPRTEEDGEGGRVHVPSASGDGVWSLMTEDSWGTMALSRMNSWKDMLVTGSGLFRSPRQGESAAAGGSEQDVDSLSVSNVGTPIDAKGEESPHNAGTHSGQNLTEWLAALRIGLKQQLEAVKRTSEAHDGDFTSTLEIPTAAGEASGEAADPEEVGATPKNKTVTFVSHQPLLFACLRHAYNITDAEYGDAFRHESMSELKPATSKSGRAFFITHDKRFILKTLAKSEASFLLDMLYIYYEHVLRFPHTLLPWHCGLYTLGSQGREVILMVETNAFSSQCPIHERYDLKGSVVGRVTPEHSKHGLDPILKDLDLKERVRLGGGWRSLLLRQLKDDCELLESLDIVDYSLLLGVHHRSGDTSGGGDPSGGGDTSGGGEGGGQAHTAASGGGDGGGDAATRSTGSGEQGRGEARRRQVAWTDGGRVRTMLSADFDSQITFNPNQAIVAVVASGDAKCMSFCKGVVGMLEEAAGSCSESISCLVLDLDDCSPHLVASLQVFNLPTLLCFQEGVETSRLVGCPSKRAMHELVQGMSSGGSQVRERRASRERSRMMASRDAKSDPTQTAAAGPSISFFRKKCNGCVSGGEAADIYYFGIVDVLQPYNFKKQVEHSLKSLVQDRSKMTIVEPSHYSQRFQTFIASIVV